MRPFNVQNYFFGITRIPFWHYVPATFLGILPGTTVNVSLAAAGHSMTLARLWHPIELALWMFGLAVTVGVCWAITRRFQTMLMRSAQAPAEL